MQPFLEAITSFPAVPLTVLLGVTVGYWLFTVISGAGFDGADAATGGVKAAGDAASAAVKGLGESAAGAIKGTSEVIAGDHSHDGDHAAEGGVLSFLGLARIPVTITGSTAVLLAWLTCVVAMLELEPKAWVLKVLLLAGSGLVGLLGAAAVLRPLGKALNADVPARRHDWLGKVCVITSGRVDASFGTASIDDGGAGLNVHVVCGASNTLKKGDRAVLVHFDPNHERYEVEPVDWLEPSELEVLRDPTRAAQIFGSRVRR